MAKRKRIALSYRLGYNFTAGVVIYIQNIIRGLNLLDDHLKPHIIVIHSEQSPLADIKEINYPYIEYYLFKPLKRNFFKLAVNKITKTFLKTYLIKRYSFPKNIDLLYPYFECEETFFYKERMYWKPDFQEQFYPQYISKSEFDFADSEMKKNACNPNYTLVLSSKSAIKDYKTYFSPILNPVKLLRFISLLPDVSHYDKGKILNEYTITDQYFLVANQFWPHKNHMLILEAMKILIDKGKVFQMVMTGKKSSYRDENYLLKMESFIKENGLEKNVKLTGFISREDQLVLMKNAICVLQPSLFEGWSTVIEDCKSLNQFVIASDLEVNIEQINTNCLFFERHNSIELAEKMEMVLDGKTKIEHYNYQLNIEEFKNNLVTVFELNR